METASSTTKQSHNGDCMSTQHVIDRDYENPSEIGSICAGENISPEECEKLVLSPPPVPLNIEAAAAAIYAAARRSNHSRNHSISGSTRSLRVSRHEAQSSNDYRRSYHEKIQPHLRAREDPKRPTGWRRLFCCFSDHMVPKKSGKAKHKSEIEKIKDDKISASEPVLNTSHSDFTVRPSADLDPELSKSNCHPVVPNTVINALISEPVSDANTSSQVMISAAEVGQPNHLDNVAIVNTKSNSSRSHNFLFPGFKRSGNADNRSLPRQQSDYTHSYYPSDDEKVDNFDRSGSQHQQQQQHYVIHQQVQNQQSYIDGDNPNALMHYHHPQYCVMPYDQSGAQGDTLCDNLDSLPPGVDLLGEISSDCVNKKCLVLDLDETLVHSSFKYVENADFIVPVEINGTIQEVFVRKRPHLDKFLKTVGPLFECVMFTASLRKYADPVCDYIDQTSCFRHRLFREACVDHQSNLIKDLSRLGRDIDQICIVDNSPISFLFQPNNALHIISWFGDTTDQALMELIPYLTGLANADTAVDYLREFRPPQKAAVPQSQTPAWLLLFNPTLSVDDSDPDNLDDEDDEEDIELNTAQGESDHNRGTGQLDRQQHQEPSHLDISYVYDKNIVLSSHYP